MQIISSIAALKAEIINLESQKYAQEKQLKEGFKAFAEQFKPVNIIKSTLYEFRRSPDLINYIIDSFIGLGVGAISKKIFTRFTGEGPVKNIMSNVFQHGMTNIVMNNLGPVKTLVHKIFNRFIQKRMSDANGN